MSGDLSEPYEGMPAKEKGQLLLRYVEERRSVAKLDFRSANLSGADLVDANLSRIDLSGADLSGAVLVDATLRHAKLDNADLRGANLMVACLDRCSLRGADLTGADLCGADLHRACFSKAKLRDCDMTLVDTFGADFDNTDLNGTSWGESRIVNVNLGTARMLGTSLWAPCSVGVEVLAATFVNVDSRCAEAVERFFRMCGVSAQVLDYFRDNPKTGSQPRDVWLHERLDEMRNLLEGQVVAQPDVREMLADQGRAHRLDKDRKLLETSVQRLSKAIAQEIKRRLFGKLGDTIQLEAENGMAMLQGTNDDAPDK